LNPDFHVDCAEATVPVTAAITSRLSQNHSLSHAGPHGLIAVNLRRHGTPV
jgi:hypothetical protein